MLSAAVKLRGAFEKMEAEDKLYCEYFLEEEENKVKRVGPPTKSDWEDVERLVKFLKIFYKSTVTFSASKSVTATLCYNEIVNIERNLIAKCGSNSEEIKKEAHVMRYKFEKYWDGLMNMNPLIIIGSVFDPRNKMQFTCLCFEQLYGKDTIEARKLHGNVLSMLRRLYAQYNERLTKPDECQASAGDSEMHTTAPSTFDVSDDDEMVEPADVMFNKMVHSSINDDGFTELDLYLTEKTELTVENALGLDYDVLSWWKLNSLSEMARDILAIQMSSVASESVFSTSGRVLDPYRSSLTPYMVEVLLCTQQWLRCSYKAESEVSNLVHMLEEVEFFDSLDARNATSTK